MKRKFHPLRALFSLILVASICFSGFKLFNLFNGIYREVTFYDKERSQAENAVMAFAQSNDLHYGEYPQELIELLERNPETEEFVLNYPTEHNKEHEINLSEYKNSESVPLFLQWDPRWGYMTYGDGMAGLTACAPVCLSMAAYYLTEDEAYSPDKMIEFSAKNGYYSWGNGTSWSLISEGAVELGFDVTEIPLVEKQILDNLEAGNPIICSMGPGDFTTTGHFIVMTGISDGKIRVNDPNSRENSEKLWEYDDISGQIRNLWVIRYFAD